MQRLSQLFRNPASASVLLTGLNVLPLAIRFFLLPIYMSVLEPDVYGILALIYIVASFFELFGNLRLQTAVQTFYFDHVDQPEKLKGYISSIFSFSVFVSAAFLFLWLLFGGPVLDWVLKGDEVEFYPDVIIALVTSFLLINIRIYFAYIKNQKLFLEYACYSLALVALNVPLQLYFLLVMEWGITGILLGSLIGTSTVCLFFIYRNNSLFRLRWDNEYIIPSIKYSVVLLPFVIFYWANQKIDRFFLERLLDLSWVGKYAALLAISHLIMIVVNAGINSFRPFLFSYFKEGRKKNEKRIITLERVFLYMIFLAASGIVLIGSNLNLIVKNPKYLEVMYLIPLATAIPISMGLAMLFNQQLIFSKQAKRISFVSFISLMVILPLYYLLIPQYQLEGLLWVNILGNMVVVCFFYYFGNKYYPVKHDLRTLFLLLLSFYGIVSLLYYAYYLEHLALGTMGWIQFLIFSICILLVGRKDIQKFIKHRK